MATTWREEFLPGDLAETAQALERVIHDLQAHGVMVPA